MRILPVFAVAFALSLLPLLWIGFRSYRRYRGKGVLICPETGKPVSVELDARRAVETELTGERKFSLQACSRWPERADCGQECLSQVEAPEDCLVRNRLARWYEGARCALCGADVGEIRWSEHRPALLGPDRQTLEWEEISPESLPALLSTHLPICWNCNMAERFRARFPDLVLDNPNPNPNPLRPARRSDPAA